MTRIGCVIMTPGSYRGAEAALHRTVKGFHDLGCEVDLVAYSSRGMMDWEGANLRAVTHHILTDKWDEVVAQLSRYDGLVLSDAYFAGGTLGQVIALSNKIPTWTTARHWTNSSVAVRERHEMVLHAPKWSGQYVSFWPAVEEAYPEIKWQRGILPFSPTQDPVPSASDRPVDFLFAGRTEPKKGVLTFAAGLEAVTRVCDLPFTARIAGAPIEMPGGPHIFAVRMMLESWGWRVEADGTKRGATWVATKKNATITHTGAYTKEDVPAVFEQARLYVNTTVGKYSRQHLEYATMESMTHGCFAMAPNDFPDYHYGVEQQPWVVPVPTEVLGYYKPGRKTPVAFDTSPDSPSTTYNTLGVRLCSALSMFKDEAKCDRTALSTWEHNMEILTKYHDPRRAATAYLQALGME